ncbi:MAG: tripartite tricarboxylate transporter substrate binding protein [Burkholderiales bacterium]|nr:tripartite tricarboxylate transporter substrate binding protein [Burkholderiales bacterium]
MGRSGVRALEQKESVALSPRVKEERTVISANRLLGLAAACLLGAGNLTVHAQSFPTKTVRVIVPFPPGGTTDMLARRLAQEMQSRWGSVIVENKAGASGTIGSEQVARAVGDPHLLLLTATHHVINPSLRKSLPYDTKREFTPLALVAVGVNVLIVHPVFPAKTVADFVSIAKAKPRSISFASSGIGGANHLSGELLNMMAGIDMMHIPYKGAAPALTDLMGGHVPVMFDGLAAVKPHLPSGKIRALAVTTLQRVPSVPNIPTVHESGVKGFEVLSWFGFYGPAQIPAPVLTEISADLDSTLGSPAIKSHFEKLGVFQKPMDRNQFARYVESEIEKWTRVIERAKIPKQ